ncbi:MAG: patatin-like phospholipase family protein [Myxococcales bacterium]|nr:patatin-like phospholipase family protein [Myxococcales bacterium]
MDPKVVRIRAWDEPPRHKEDQLDTKPLAVCISGGGFRSYACALGQLRALHDLGVMPHVGLLCGVSGGAWAVIAHTYALGDVRDRLGASLPPEALDLQALSRAIGEGHLGHPVTQLDTANFARRSRGRLPRNRLFGHVLAKQVLEPLGVDVDREVLSAAPAHTQALLARNPRLTSADVLEAPPGRPPAVVAASALLPDDTGLHYEPVELSALALTTSRALPGWPLRAVELAAVLGTPRDIVSAGDFEVELSQGAFALPDLLGATGGAVGGVLVQLSRRLGIDPGHLVLHAAHWLGPGSTPFLVDGGYVENTGIIPALRRGAMRLAVFVNTKTAVPTGKSARHVDGVDGQISRLFGRAPTRGMYSGDPLPLFPEAELAAVSQGFRASAARGELPWALVDHQIRPDNALQLEPRSVRIYWQVNEVPASWAARLPAEVQRALSSRFGTLHGVPHLSVAFAHGRYPFRLHSAQVAIMQELHAHALQSRPREVWQGLLG